MLVSYGSHRQLTRCNVTQVACAADFASSKSSHSTLPRPVHSCPQIRSKSIRTSSSKIGCSDAYLRQASQPSTYAPEARCSCETASLPKRRMRDYCPLSHGTKREKAKALFRTVSRHTSASLNDNICSLQRNACAGPHETASTTVLPVGLVQLPRRSVLTRLKLGPAQGL